MSFSYATDNTAASTQQCQICRHAVDQAAVDRLLSESIGDDSKPIWQATPESPYKMCARCVQAMIDGKLERKLAAFYMMRPDLS